MRVGPNPRGRPRTNGLTKIKYGSKRKILACPHTDRSYYAKGMCVNCYHRQGRTKTAWACPHKSSVHYSKGLCKNCYLANYYQFRPLKRKARLPVSEVEILPLEQSDKVVSIEEDGLLEEKDHED